MIFCPLPSLSKIIEYIPCGAKAPKIKKIDHRKCNVGASKNAEQAFSTQRYLYSCDGLFFYFRLFRLIN